MTILILYRIFYLLRRLFAKHQTLSSWCWIFRSWSRSHKFGFYQYQFFLFTVVIVISILLKTTFSQISIHNQLLVKILQRSDKEKTLLRRLKKIGMASQKPEYKHLKFLRTVFFMSLLCVKCVNTLRNVMAVINESFLCKIQVLHKELSVYTLFVIRPRTRSGSWPIWRELRRQK